MELTSADRRMEGADRSDHGREVAELRDEIRRMEALVAHFRTTMGNGFFLTVQHTATLNGLRKDLGHKLNGPETDAQREARLDAEADEAMDHIAAVLMAGRNEDALVESPDAETDEADGPKRAKTIDEQETDDDEFFRRFAAGRDSLLG